MKYLKRVLNYLLQPIFLVLTVYGFYLPKALGICFAILTYGFLGKSGLSIIAAILVYVIILNLLLPVARFIIDYSSIASNSIRTNTFNYIKTYGEDFKKPEMQTFNLEKEEYYSYNKRFKIDTEIIPIIPCLIFSFVTINMTDKRGFYMLIFIITISIILFYVTKRIINYLNYRIARKYYQHEKVTAYNKACEIYKRIQDEIKDNLENERTKKYRTVDK